MNSVRFVAIFTVSNMQLSAVGGQKDIVNWYIYIKLFSLFLSFDASQDFNCLIGRLGIVLAKKNVNCNIQRMSD